MGTRIKDKNKIVYNKVLDTVKKYNMIQKGDKILLGVSGGPDSICMLNILNDMRKDINFDIIVAHVNHLIRNEAKQDEEFVIDFCKKLNIDCYTKSIDVQKIANNTKIGLEEAGRIERYKFFDEILKKFGCNKIAIAHNKNDNVETVFMHILRGSGISGLKGIEPVRGKYIRPLVEIDRQDIEEYCKSSSILPRIDKSNFENDYTRNKIRNVVIPYIKKEFNPNIIQTMYRLSNLVQEEEKYINDVVAEKYTEIMILEDIEQKNILQSENKIILSLKKFNTLEKVIKSKVILYTISRLIGNSKGIEKVHIDDIIKLCENNIGNKYLMPNKNFIIFN